MIGDNVSTTCTKFFTAWLAMVFFITWLNWKYGINSGYNEKESHASLWLGNIEV
jgi:hypothetical protein